MRAVITTILLLFFFSSFGQTVLGTTGYLNIPSADMQEDGTFYFGGSYLDKQYLETYGTGDNNAFTYYFDLTFLPFLEINFGNTRLIKPTGDQTTVDRRFSFRFRPLRERKYVPAIVIGAHDIFTSTKNSTDASNQYFSSLYIVLTKNIAVKKSEFGITLGYGIDAFNNNQFLGLFGGVTFSPGFYRPMKFIAEYDGKGINLGINALLFKHLFVYAMVNDFQYFSGGVAYHVYLLNNIKKKRKARNKK